MFEIDKGHSYELDVIDGYPNQTSLLIFVKRDNPPENYPGNVGSHPGTNNQEVLRALIKRTLYLKNQAVLLDDLESVVDDEFQIDHYRSALISLERRAARKHGRELVLTQDEKRNIENLPTCKACGHIKCGNDCKRKKAK